MLFFFFSFLSLPGTATVWMILVTLIISQLLVNIWMFYAKAVNCCADVRDILATGTCRTGPCPNVTSDCAALPQLFALEPIQPEYPNGLSDYTCHAFPDDDKPVDSFIVGLISIAIALPVSLFLATCFSIANDSEAPENWLEWCVRRVLRCAAAGVTSSRVCAGSAGASSCLASTRTGSGTTPARRGSPTATSGGSCAALARRPRRRLSTFGTALWHW